MKFEILKKRIYKKFIQLKTKLLSKKFLIFLFIVINFYSASCENFFNQSKIDFKRHKLGSRGRAVELSCDYSCKLQKKKGKQPIGIINESNFCYLISLLQVLASVERLYEISEVCSVNESIRKENTKLCGVYHENSYRNKIVKKLNQLLKKLRAGLDLVKKEDLRELVVYFEKEGWLNEHGNKRKFDDPRDPSLLLKFLLKSIASDKFKLTSVIKESDIKNEFSYCIDSGIQYYDVKPKCYLNEFPLEKLDNEILIVISVYNDKDLRKTITYKTQNLLISKEKANSKDDIKYTASGFIQIKPNGNGGNHATAYVKRGNDWFHCNDDIVLTLENSHDIEKLISSEDTVLIVYERTCDIAQCK